ncbi:DUF4438 domain-containing protein [Longicatena caecimuris]|uniref:DUF4438 domain-containing protein n=1 Tax=Longicatena caecimuris TaxID=1796635 RepID=UPI0022E7FDBE|nr:DUF4438 domain-containing protein [Longicatena caecimuris]
MKMNKDRLVVMSVQGSVDHPSMAGNAYRVGYDGFGRIPMATGGIVYNYKIKDSCMGIAGDHVEPGVSLKNPVERENNALQAFACIGNQARIISGDAKGRIGYVTGKHGGIDHVMVYFDEETLDLMTCDDRVHIKAFGQGLKLLDHEEIHVMNIDPSLLEKLNIKEHEDSIEIGVTTIVPAHLMGSGLGSATTMLGDYDIMTQDKKANETYHINDLRFGDIVAVLDHDNHHGPHYLEGAITIGVVVHSDSFSSGHGPGLTVILSSKTKTIKPFIDKDANIANYLDIQ